MPNKINLNKLELLAPAGNLAKLKTAFAFGADAVYGGVPQFSMRANPKKGFTLVSLKEGIDYAHSINKKVYITINIIAHNYHLQNLEKYITKIIDLQPDALIVADPGVMHLIRKHNKKIEIHLSTQANATNYETVAFWKEQGIKRIILARELTLKEIKQIKDKVRGVELEIFVHGSMCMAYSGRCLLSHYLAGKHANQGMCTHPCRWKYELKAVNEGDDADGVFNIEQDTHGTYFMSSQDMRLVEYLDKVLRAGVMSLKIEGRQKSIYYVGSVIRVYRQALVDLAAGRKYFIENIPKYKHELNTIANRGYWPGFAVKKVGKLGQTYTSSRSEYSNYRFVGEVLQGNSINHFNKETKIVDSKHIIIKVHNKISKGDSLEILTPNSIDPVVIKANKLISILPQNHQEEVEVINSQKHNLLMLEVKKDIPSYSLVRKKIK